MKKWLPYLLVIALFLALIVGMFFLHAYVNPKAWNNLERHAKVPLLAFLIFTLYNPVNSIFGG